MPQQADDPEPEAIPAGRAERSELITLYREFGLPGDLNLEGLLDRLVGREVPR